MIHWSNWSKDQPWLNQEEEEEKGWVDKRRLKERDHKNNNNKRRWLKKMNNFKWKEEKERKGVKGKIMKENSKKGLIEKSKPQFRKKGDTRYHLWCVTKQQ